MLISRRREAGSPPAVRPRVRVRLADVERLAPPDADAALRRAWLRAPMLGLPLYRRILEAFVGLDVSVVRCDDGPVGRTFAELAAEEPVFGFRVSVGESEWRAADGAFDLFVPGGGPTFGDVAAACARAAAAAPRRVLLAPVATQDGGRAAAVFAARDRLGEDGAAGARDFAAALRSVPAGERSALCAGPLAVREAGHPAALRALAADALEGMLGSWTPAGRWRGELLLAPNASAAADAHAAGPSELGRGSSAGPGAVLGPGAATGAFVWIGGGARVASSVVLDGSDVAPGVALRGVVRFRRSDYA